MEPLRGCLGFGAIIRYHAETLGTEHFGLVVELFLPVLQSFGEEKKRFVDFLVNVVQVDFVLIRNQLVIFPAIKIECKKLICNNKSYNLSTEICLLS